MRKVIVLAIDGLGTGMLGPYGSSFAPTPAFCRLANQSLLMDHAIIDSPALSENYQSLLSGVHGCSGTNHKSCESLPELLGCESRESLLIADHATANDLSFADHFTNHIQIEIPESDGTAEDAEESWMAHFFSETIQALQMRRDQSCTWIHCPGMVAPWDAPYEFRLQFVDDDEPDPTKSDAPPAIYLPADADPDELHGYQCSYGAQMMLLDMMLDAFMDSLAGNLDETLLIVFGLRGYPLGEHGIVGLAEQNIQAELIQVPMFFKYADFNECLRFQGLVQFGDVFCSIANWLGVGRPDPASIDLKNCMLDLNHLGRPVAISRSNKQISIRTEHWHGIRAAANSIQLFVKPDDRWNRNDVSELCADQVADIQAFAERIKTATSMEGLLKEVPENLLMPHE